jgi:type I restriction enzyme S subunit
MFYTEPVHKNQTNCKFIYYAAKTIPYDRYKTATALPSMTQTDLGSHILAYPPFEEQQSIASFLDAKTKPIDDIISKREKQIELLEEMKSAIISHAVTKGLNPDVKMKDSGIEWIGEIPEDWTTSTIGRIYTIILGKMLCPQAPNITYSLESYYCAADVHFYGINNDDLKEMWFSPEEKKRYKVYVNDLLVVEGGAGAGGCFVVKEDSNAYIQNSIMIVRSCNNSTHYLKYFIENIVKRGFVYFECNKATFPHYTREKLSSTRIPVPPLSEQQAIASYLDTETSKLDTRIAKRRRQIELLQEYKQALITDAVTGKIDVREYNKRI